MPQYILRPFIPSDSHQACTVLRENLRIVHGINVVAREMLTRKCSPGQVARESLKKKTFVVVSDNRLTAIGTVCENRIHRLFVARNRQNMGIGTFLLEQLLCEIKRDGFQQALVDSYLGASSFYLARGFNSLGLKEVIYEAAHFQYASMSKPLSLK